MKSEFIPSQFKESDGECKICDARKELELSLAAESNLLVQIGSKGMTASPLLDAHMKMWPIFASAVSDYRVCFAQNLALYFTAERHGRLRKVPEFLGACDEYRKRALESLSQFDSAFQEFKTVSQSAQQAQDLQDAIAQLVTAHGATMSSAQAFWDQIDIWTEARNKTARNLFGKSE